MTSSRPYMIRAMYQWIKDNDNTVHILVNAKMPEVQVPQDYVVDGQIVLNISPEAIHSLMMGDDSLSFVGRFKGAPCNIKVPVPAVMGVYSKETGMGMLFDEPTSDTFAETVPTVEVPTVKRSAPTLRLVK